MGALLEKNPNKRLGSGGSEEVKQHEFFADVDWQKVYKKEIHMEIPPKRDTSVVPSYFDVFGISKAALNSRKIAGFTYLGRMNSSDN